MKLKILILTYTAPYKESARQKYDRKRTAFTKTVFSDRCSQTWVSTRFYFISYRVLGGYQTATASNGFVLLWRFDRVLEFLFNYYPCRTRVSQLNHIFQCSLSFVHREALTRCYCTRATIENTRKLQNKFVKSGLNRVSLVAHLILAGKPNIETSNYFFRQTVSTFL